MLNTKDLFIATQVVLHCVQNLYNVNILSARSVSVC